MITNTSVEVSSFAAFVLFLYIYCRSFLTAHDFDLSTDLLLEFCTQSAQSRVLLDRRPIEDSDA